MKLADAYPELDAVASAHATALEEIATRPAHQDESLTLSSCCWRVRRDIEDEHSPVDASAALATLDAYLQHFDESALPRAPFWRRLQSARESGFIDLVVEAAMALFQRDASATIELERLIPTSSAVASKNVDLFLVDRHGNEWWMDLVAIQRSSHQPTRQIRAAHQLAEHLERKIRRKYLDKFGAAIRDGTIPSGRASLGLCVVKWPELVPLIRAGLPWSDDLWQECPGLGRVELFHLERSREGRYQSVLLEPVNR